MIAHNERFARLDANGAADPTNGIRHIIVGTGGAGLRTPDYLTHPQSEALDWNSYGVIELTLHATSFDWRFAGVPGASFTDTGTDACH